MLVELVCGRANEMAIRKNVRWSGCGAPVSEQRIADVQRRFGVRFPPAFLEWVRACDGGCPGDLSYKVRLTGYEGPLTFDVGRLVTFREPMPLDLRKRLRQDHALWDDLPFTPWISIEEYCDDPPEGLTPGLVPFADEGSGNLLCFDWRRNRSDLDPPVVFWAHDWIDEDPVVVLANNFEAFVELLEVGTGE
jgi:hypothetical protein